MGSAQRESQPSHCSVGTFSLWFGSAGLCGFPVLAVDGAVDRLEIVDGFASDFAQGGDAVPFAEESEHGGGVAVGDGAGFADEAGAVCDDIGEFCHSEDEWDGGCLA